MQAIVVLLATLFAPIWYATAASAQTAAALVLETRGTMAPPLAPYAEIAGGTTVVLPGGARLVFLHYQTCTTVTVVGGEVVVGQASYRATNGATPVTVRATCPARVRLKEQGESAGIITRSLPPPSGLSTRPSFILVGARAGTFARFRVARDGTTVLEGSLTGREFRWPADAAPLDAHAEYEIILLRPMPESRRATLKFRPVESSSAGGNMPLTLISVED